jgi:hypothetical protein
MGLLSALREGQQEKNEGLPKKTRQTSFNTKRSLAGLF